MESEAQRVKRVEQGGSVEENTLVGRSALLLGRRMKENRSGGGAARGGGAGTD